MEPYSWAVATAEEMFFLRQRGSPYVFAQAYQPEWADILHEALISRGVAEAWIYQEGDALLVRFPENSETNQSLFGR